MKIQIIDVLFQCGAQGQMIESIARKSLYGNGDTGIVHEKKEYELYKAEADWDYENGKI